MTITQLDTFLKIAETKNFTLAATLLGYAQSTVTMQIKQLEDELGCLLFDRLGKKVVLTVEGRRLLLYAKKMTELEREIRLSVPEGDAPSGILKIGISESLCYRRIPELLMDYRNAYPEVSIEIRFITHDVFPQLLRNGDLDIVYTLNPLIESEELKLLHKQKESLGLYVSPASELASRKSVKEKDLEGISLLLTSHNCNFRAMLLSALEKQGIRPHVALETTNKSILKQFAQNGLGVAFIPDMTAMDEGREGSLVRLPWKGSDFPIYSQLFVHKDKHLSPAIKAFTDMVKSIRDHGK